METPRVKNAAWDARESTILPFEAPISEIDEDSAGERSMGDMTVDMDRSLMPAPTADMRKRERSSKSQRSSGIARGERKKQKKVSSSRGGERRMRFADEVDADEAVPEPAGRVTRSKRVQVEKLKREHDKMVVQMKHTAEVRAYCQ